MAKNRKNDINSFEGIFLGTEENEKKNNKEVETLQEQKEETKDTEIETLKEPTAKGRPKENRETKITRSFVVFPSVYEDTGKIAYIERISISEIISKLLKEYVKENEDKIKEYDQLKIK